MRYLTRLFLTACLSAPQLFAKSRTRRVLAKAAPTSLRLLFFVYPIVTQQAFRAFSCHTFDEGSPIATHWLRADVAIQCGSGEHFVAMATAWVGIILYPVGILLFFAWLLYIAREDIVAGRRTELSAALKFLHGDFEREFFYWGEPPVSHL